MPYGQQFILLWVQDELNIPQAKIITRNEINTFSNANKAIQVIPFYRWAIETFK